MRGQEEMAAELTSDGVKIDKYVISFLLYCIFVI